MKKLFKCLLAITCCLSLTACGKSESQSEEELIQEKIESAGWKISKDFDSSDSVYSIFLDVDNSSYFAITSYKDSGSLKSISYTDTIDKDDYLYVYSKEEDASLGHVIQNGTFVCSGYDADQQNFIYDSSKNSLCTDQNIQNLQDTANKLDSALKESNLTYNELEQWAKWYYKQN